VGSGERLLYLALLIACCSSRKPCPRERAPENAEGDKTFLPLPHAKDAKEQRARREDCCILVCSLLVAHCSLGYVLYDFVHVVLDVFGLVYVPPPPARYLARKSPMYPSSPLAPKADPLKFASAIVP